MTYLLTFLLAIASQLGAQPPGPRNLTLDAGTPGAPPENWFAGNPRFKAEFRREGCQVGAGCAMVPGPESPAANVFGNLMQSVNARPYRGKILVFRGAVKVESQGSGQLWFRVDRENGGRGAFDNMSDRPVRAPDWTFHEIIAEVADDATFLNFGVMAMSGTVWADSFSLEEWKPSAEESEARAAIQKLYAEADTTAAQGDMAGAMEKLMAPDAVMRESGHVSTREQILARLRSLSAGVKASATTRVWHTKVEGSSALVRVTQSGSMSMGGAPRWMESASRDRWVRLAEGWRLQESTVLSMREVTPPVDAASAKRVTEELKRKAVPLTGVEAGKPSADLTAFGKAVGDARIVALGEATHGTREIFQMKHRLFEYLVREKGFTVFAFEANWPESEAADRYVKGGGGDPGAALKAMYFWTWQTEEVRDLLDWMRAYNKEHGNKLSFTSFDMQTADVALAKAAAYAKETLPSETAPSGAAELVAWLEERKPRLTTASSGDKFVIALQAARVAHQADTLRRGGAAFSYRDEMMARNVEWLANEAYPGQKIVLWAHNGHVTRDGRAYKAMGDWLSKSFPSMYVLGFAVHTGEVRAVTVENGKRIGLAASPMPAAPDGSGTAILSAAGHPAFFLDLRTQDGELRDWLAQPHNLRSCGSQWNRDDPDRQLTSETLAKAYDGLVFLEKTTAARGLR